MPPDWHHLKNETVAAQLTFLDAEADTGITLARIALSTRDHDKAARDGKIARKAYETIAAYLDELPAETPGLAAVREKVATLRQLLHSLEEKR